MRRVSAVIVTFLVLAIGGWSLLWAFAAHKSASVLDAWIENESQLGRNWTCSGRRIGGYPLDIRLSCDELQFHGEIFAEDFTGSLQGLYAVASVLHPDRIKVRMKSPFAGTTPDGDIDLQIEWDALNVDIEGRPNALTKLTVASDGFAVKGSAGNLGSVDAKAHSLLAFIAPASNRGEAALDFQIVSNGVTAPSLAVPLGLEAPLDAVIGGTVFLTNLMSAGGSPAQRLERWRAGGGHVELKTLRLTSGATKLVAIGVIDIDEAHRPRGKLDAAFEGFNPVLRRLGVDPQILAAGSLFTSFLHKSPGGADASDSIRLPLRLSEGRIAIGPIRTPLHLPALY